MTKIGGFLILAVCAFTPGIGQDKSAETTVSAVLAEGSDSKPKEVLPTATVWKNARELADADKAAEAVAYIERFAAETARPYKDRSRLLAWAAYMASKDKETGAEDYGLYIQRSIDMDAGTGHHMAVLLIGVTENKPQAVESFGWLIKNVPVLAKQIEVRAVWKMVTHLQDADQEAEVYRLLSDLAKIEYAGGTKGARPQFLYFRLAELELERGNVEAAKSLAEKWFKSTNLFIEIWHDRRFEPLWNFLQELGRFDPQKLDAFGRENAQAKEVAARGKSWEEWLSARNGEIHHRRSFSHDKEAETLAIQTMAIVPEGQKTLDGYFWLQNTLAYIYEDQGKSEEALQLMKGMSDIDPKVNNGLVSQVINYSSMLWRMGKHKQAIKIADRVLEDNDTSASDYGNYWAYAAKACAQNSSGNEAAALTTFANMEEKPESNYAAVVKAGLCLNKLDYVAEIYIKRLADEDYRGDALFALSTFQKSPIVDGETVLRERLLEVARRGDIVLAVNTVGRTGDWPFPITYWGKY